MRIGKHTNQKEKNLEVNKVRDNTRRRMQGLNDNNNGEYRSKRRRETRGIKQPLLFICYCNNNNRNDLLWQ